jgi:hypothetical protein
MGAGMVFKHADLRLAAKTFLSVRWQEIADTIAAIASDVSTQLEENGLRALNDEWTKEVHHIVGVLKGRFSEVSAHAKHVLST